MKGLTSSEQATYRALRARGWDAQAAMDAALDGVDVEDARERKRNYSVLLVEAEHDEIIRIRKMLNEPGARWNRNMIWRKGRRAVGGMTYEGLSAVLTLVIEEELARAKSAKKRDDRLM